jgi:1-acyl-sn-glycerol-3-phosphate acyltransferase
MRRLAQWLLKINGWKRTDTVPELPDKFVLMIAPHTSMWDFVWGRLMTTSLGLNVRFLIKQEVFWFPLGGVLRWMGGMPVNRSRGNQMIQQVVDELARKNRLVIVITPEGTRSPIARWKKGFYHIAVGAGIPIGVGYLDYKTKTYGIGRFIHPTGNFLHDFSEALEVYAGKMGKHPQRFLLPDLRGDEDLLKQNR